MQHNEIELGTVVVGIGYGYTKDFLCEAAGNGFLRRRSVEKVGSWRRSNAKVGSAAAKYCESGFHRGEVL
jgi:hypothetical protein